MPWSASRPRGGAVNPMYRTKEHRDTRAAHMAALRQAGIGRCAELVCIKRTRAITPDMDLHLCHDRRTGQPLGLGHAACNRREAAVHARAKQNATTLRW